MKKSFLAIGIAALSILASCERPPQDELVLLDAPTTAFSNEATEFPIVISFKSTLPWTAAVNTEAQEFLSLDLGKSGEAGEECKVKLSLTENTGKTQREGTVTISAGSLTPLVVTIRQKGDPSPYFELDKYGPVAVPVEGGKVTIGIGKNVEFSLTDYNGTSFPYQKAVLNADSTSVEVTISANAGYAARQSYIKFMIPAFQVPDPNGEPGDMMDSTVRVYFDQAGRVTTLFESSIPAEGTYTMKHTAKKYSIAAHGANHYICDSKELFVVNPLAGAITGKVDFGKDSIACICSDYAKNLVFVCCDPIAEGVPGVQLYLVKAGETTPSLLLQAATNEVSGCYGFANFNINGDVTTDAIISCFGAVYGGTQNVGAYWNIINGDVQDVKEYKSTGVMTAQPQYKTTPVTHEFWASGRAAFAALDDGFCYSGYDGTCAFQVYKDDWTEGPVFGSWASAVSSLQPYTWGKRHILGVFEMGWFYYTPSVLHLLDVDNNFTEFVSFSFEDASLTELWCSASVDPSTDVMFETLGPNLLVLAIDSAHGKIGVYSLPPID